MSKRKNNKYVMIIGLVILITMLVGVSEAIVLLKASSNFMNKYKNKKTNNSITVQQRVDDSVLDVEYSDKIMGDRCYVYNDVRAVYHITYCQPQDSEKKARCKYDKKDGVSVSATVTRANLRFSLSECQKTSKKGDIHTIYLYNGDANVEGSTNVYEKYDVGIYLDNPPKNVMNSTLNPIKIPKKNNYTFGGYYTGPNGQGKKMINEKGYITSSFTSKTFNAGSVLHAKWIKSSTNVTTIKYNRVSGGKFVLVNNPETLHKEYLADKGKGNRLLYKSEFNGTMELYYEHQSWHENNFHYMYAIRFYNPNSSNVTLTINKSGASYNHRWQDTYKGYYNSKKQSYTIKPNSSFVLFHSCDDKKAYCSYTTAGSGDNYRQTAYYFGYSATIAGKKVDSVRELDGVLNVTSTNKLLFSTFIFEDYDKTFEAKYPGNSTRNTNGHDGDLRVYSGEVNYLPELYNNAKFEINDSMSANQNLKVTYDGNDVYDSWITNMNKKNVYDDRIAENVYFNDLLPLKFKDDKNRNVVTNPLPSRDSRIKDSAYSHFNIGNWGVHYHENITINNTGNKARTVSFRFKSTTGDATYAIVEDTKNIKGINTSDFIIRQSSPIFERHVKSSNPEEKIIWKATIPAKSSITVPYIFTLGGMSAGTMEKYVYLES